MMTMISRFDDWIKKKRSPSPGSYSQQPVDDDDGDDVTSCLISRPQTHIVCFSSGILASRGYNSQNAPYEIPPMSSASSTSSPDTVEPPLLDGYGQKSPSQ